MPSVTTILEEARLAGQALLEYAGSLVNPTVRLGVTGLTHAGKTVFITALVHNLLHGGRLPVFEAFNSGRIARARLEPQPDDAVPRFDYETHIQALIDARRCCCRAARRVRSSPRPGTRIWQRCAPKIRRTSRRR